MTFRLQNVDLPFVSNVYNKNQENYLALLPKLHGVTIVDSIGTIGSAGQCLLFADDGLSMWMGDNHHSIVGSDFHAGKFYIRFSISNDSYMSCLM